MTIALVCPNKDPKPWVDALKQLAPDLDIIVWSEDDRTREKNQQVEFILAWQPPPNVWNNYPKVKAISSMGAGVDFLLSDNLLPKNIPIARLVTDQLAASMIDYLDTQVNAIRHHLHFYQAEQTQSNWAAKAPLKKSDLTIGIMGLGQLGVKVASHFVSQKYPVVGWSQSEKSISGVCSYQGEDNLNIFLNTSQVLINLLPLTDLTQNILNLENLSKLPHSAYLINVGRGGHLIEEDLITLLNKNKLAGAVLDVFKQEPLPENNPLWHHPKMTITPHVSSLTEPTAVAEQIIDNYHRAKQGKPLLNQVDRKKGY